MIHAAQRNEIPSNDQFKIVNSLHGAVQTLTTGSADVFYWEKYMTRPNVRSGELRLIGEFSAPWSSFLIIVSDEAMQKKRDAVLELLSIMNGECIAFKQDNIAPSHFGKVIQGANADYAAANNHRTCRRFHANHPILRLPRYVRTSGNAAIILSRKSQLCDFLMLTIS
jgi:hypothetical protein